MHSYGKTAAERAKNLIFLEADPLSLLNHLFAALPTVGESFAPCLHPGCFCSCSYSYGRGCELDAAVWLPRVLRGGVIWGAESLAQLLMWELLMWEHRAEAKEALLLSRHRFSEQDCLAWRCLCPLPTSLMVAQQGRWYSGREAY